MNTVSKGGGFDFANVPKQDKSARRYWQIFASLTIVSVWVLIFFLYQGIPIKSTFVGFVTPIVIVCIVFTGIMLWADWLSVRRFKSGRDRYLEATHSEYDHTLSHCVDIPCMRRLLRAMDVCNTWTPPEFDDVEISRVQAKLGKALEQEDRQKKEKILLDQMRGVAQASGEILGDPRLSPIWRDQHVELIRILRVLMLLKHPSQEMPRVK